MLTLLLLATAITVFLWGVVRLYQSEQNKPKYCNPCGWKANTKLPIDNKILWLI